MINCHDACQAFMSNAPSMKGRRIIIAPLNYSCVEPHECFTSIIIECACTRLNVKYLMLATLDFQNQREWEPITASRADTPTGAEFVTFLESRCRALSYYRQLNTERSS